MNGDPERDIPAEAGLEGDLPDGAARLALLHTPVRLRDEVAALLALDARLARIAGQTTEVMLGQMRLAWWRDMLKSAPSERPQGDAVLDALSRHWQGRETVLGELVDGWEVLVAAEAMSRDEALAFARGRGAPFKSLAGPDAERAEAAATRWALADAAPRLSSEEERALFVSAGLEIAVPRSRLPRALKGLAVLDALALRALKRGGRPLMEGRGAALTAMRAAIIGG